MTDPRILDFTDREIAMLTDDECDALGARRYSRVGDDPMTPEWSANGGKRGTWRHETPQAAIRAARDELRKAQP